MAWNREDVLYEDFPSHTANEKLSTSSTVNYDFDLKKRINGINALESADFDDLVKDISETFGDIEKKYGKRMVDDLKWRMEDKGIYVSYYAPEVIQSIRYAGHSGAHDSYEFFVMETDLQVYDKGSNSFVTMRVSDWSFVEHKGWTSVLIDGEDITLGQKAKKVKDKTTMNRTLWLFLKPAWESVKKSAVEQYEANIKRRANTSATPQDIELRTIPSGSTIIYTEVAQNQLVDLKEWESKQVASWRTYKRVWGEIYYNSLNTDGAVWATPDATRWSVHNAGRFLEQNGNMIQMQSVYLSVGSKSYVLYNPSMPNQLFNEHGIPLEHPVWSSDPRLFVYNGSYDGDFIISYTNNRLDLWITKSADAIREEKRQAIKLKIYENYPDIAEQLYKQVTTLGVMDLAEWEKKEVEFKRPSDWQERTRVFVKHDWRILFQSYTSWGSTNRSHIFHDLENKDLYLLLGSPPTWVDADDHGLYKMSHIPMMLADGKALMVMYAFGKESQVTLYSPYGEDLVETKKAFERTDWFYISYDDTQHFRVSFDKTAKTATYTEITTADYERAAKAKGG